MLELEVIRDPEDKRLQEPTKKVKDVTAPKILGIVNAMKHLQVKEKAVGLAANQCGIPLKIITAYHEGLDEILEFINPRLIFESLKIDNLKWSEEGCLSHPGIRAEVARYRYIQFIAQTLKHGNKEIKFEAQGMLAVIIQHEICHLENLLITDMGPYKRNVIVVPTEQITLLNETKKRLEEGQKDFVLD